MPLPTTDFFERTLRPPYEALCLSPQARQHLSGVFRFDGRDLHSPETIEIEGAVLTSEEAAHLLMVFDGSRVHVQEQHIVGLDDGPPGTYFTTVNADVVQEGHKNRVGIYDEEDGPGLFLNDLLTDADVEDDGGAAQAGMAVHVDHFFLRHQAIDGLGPVTFALCAITAHCLGYRRISLVAGGGRGFDQGMIGYRFWPKLGFDALLEEGVTDGAPHLANCQTVQEVRAIDEAWWDRDGTQHWMEFDLAADSPGWQMLLDYLREKELI